MCFSAEASFAGGVIISSIGIATIKQAHKPTQLVFASIPLFFGFQQIAEGFLWLSLLYPQFALLQKPSTYIFLIMAQLIWPFVIPLSTLLMEENKKRIKVLRILLGIGISLALYYTFCLLSFNINPQIIGCHIKYNADYPQFLVLITFTIYLIVTIVPLFISTVKNLRVLGALMILSCLIAIIFFTYWVTSVWCFFAAIISVAIFWILRESKKKSVKQN